MSVRCVHAALAVGLCLAGGAVVRAQNGDDLVPGMTATAPTPQAPRRTVPAAPAGPVPPSAAPAPRSPAPARPPEPVQVHRPADSAAPVRITASVDRTAVWIGEPFVYTVDVVCPPGTDILAADLSRDRLRPTGIDIVDSTETRTIGDDGTIHYRVQFRLTSFLLDGTTARLAPQPVRYYTHTAGQAADKLVPADEVALDPVAIAVRSTIPDQNVLWLRDARPVATLSPLFTLLAPIGYVVGAASLLPLSYGAWMLLRGRLSARVPRPAKTAREYRARIDEIRALDTSTPVGRVAALQAVSEVIRERLSDVGIPAPGLTADELGPVLADKAPKLAALDIVPVLRTCERALYGGPDHLPAAGVVTPALEMVEQLLSARPR